MNDVSHIIDWKKGRQVQILDHGYVKLVDFMGGDESVIEAARMSVGTKGFVGWKAYQRCKKCGFTMFIDQSGAIYGDGSCPTINGATVHDYEIAPRGDLGLLEFLLKNWHTTPFEMCELVVEVQAPIFAFREWHRHRTQSYNELSARYTQMPDLHYVPDKSRLAAVKSKNKQESSLSESDAALLDPDAALDQIVEQQREIYALYDELIKKGVPKEVARINTPVSRYSRMRAKTDLLNWLKFLNLRMRPNVLWELRQYANCLGEIIDQLFPRTYQLFEEWWLYARSFGRTELKALNDLFTVFAETPDWLREGARKAGLGDRQVEDLLKKLLTPADTLL